MRITTWNVNGIRSVFCKEKDGTKSKTPINNNVVTTLLTENDPDVLCLQEIKCSKDVDISNTLGLTDLGYQFCGVNCAISKKGYSGTCIISKKTPISVIVGFGDFNNAEELNNEGRVLTVEYEKVFVVNVYTPNSKPDLSRLEFRVNVWDKIFRDYCTHLQSKKPIIVCGDFNVAPEDIDVNNPKSAKGSHGFTVQEKTSFKSLLDGASLVDSYRTLHKETVAYTWYSPFARSRERNKGWRIDHILVSSRVKNKISKCEVLGDFFGSDHVPCTLDIKV
jgi:exodeoxyribonuclease-3